jgi:hypothetical protein
MADKITIPDIAFEVIDMGWNARRVAFALHHALCGETTEAKLAALEASLQAAYDAGLVQGICQRRQCEAAQSDDVARWRDMGYGREFWSQGVPTVKDK